MRTLTKIQLHITCALVLAAVRLGLWCTSYQTVRRHLVRPCDPQNGPGEISAVARVARAVRRSARGIPSASCLSQSIACQAVLSRHGIPSTLHICAGADSGGCFAAHAWLSWDGKVVLDSGAATGTVFGQLLELPTPDLRSTSF